MKKTRRHAPFVVLGAALALVAVTACDTTPEDQDPEFTGSVVVGHELATEAVLRAIPETYVDAARTTLHVAYEHTSHGTHVSYGLYGLPDFQAGDDALFGVTQNASTPEADKLDFHDQEMSAAHQDLSQADSSWSTWVNDIRAYLDDADNAAINVMMWSWCDISGHDVDGGYLPSMQTLIDEYGTTGSKIGTGIGKTRATPVTFVFMTGHAYTNNEADGRPKNQADLINAYCEDNGYLCLDYYSIDSHDMDGDYYADASDDAQSTIYGGNFYQDWQDTHAEGTDWFYNQSSPGGSSTTSYGSHLSQHITSNRKAYAMWYILARIAGWDGESTE